MPEAPAPGTQPLKFTVLGWLIAIGFTVLLWNIVEMPRTALELREPLKIFHFSAGLVVSVLALLRIFWWFTGPTLNPPPGLPDASFAFHRSILLALLITFAIETLIGAVYAWGIGDEVPIFGMHLPSLLEKSEATRMAYGYFHSALGFFYLMLISIWLAFGFYQHFRYRSGLARLLPGARV